MKPIRSTSALLVFPLLAAAGLLAFDAGAQDPPGPDAGSREASAETRVPAAVPSSGETYVVTVGSGPFAGTYRGTDELNCIIGDETWSADFDEDRDRGVTALLVHLEGVSETGGTTEDAHLSVMFGRPGEPGFGAVGAGASTGGALRATAERDGADAVMRLEGTTSYGAAVTATVRCRSVD
ncbi:MAG: hypothetical protein KY467_09355 [Gemmatimonadetes bacterium]|nr:hypothetical protein [Gemmatimonadota bacterium]